MTFRILAALVFAASVVPVQGATDPDPLKSQACKDALAAMEQVFATPASLARAARVAAAREEAAVACLGRSAGRAARSGAPEPVRPPVMAGPAAPSVAPAATSPAPALAIPRPTVITTCDPGGCWDSEGRRLNSMGPLLMSPRGPCTVQGSIATCP